MCKWHSAREQDKFVHFLNGPRQKEGRREEKKRRRRRKNKKIQVYPRLSITNVLLLLDQCARHNFSPLIVSLFALSHLCANKTHQSTCISTFCVDCVFTIFSSFFLFFFAAARFDALTSRYTSLISTFGMESDLFLLVSTCLFFSFHLTVFVGVASTNSWDDRELFATFVSSCRWCLVR